METEENKNKQNDPGLFNIEQVNKMGNKDEGFTHEMIKKFIVVATQCGQNLNAAIKSNNWLKLKEVARKNIPSYSVMALTELVGLLKNLEKHAQEVHTHAFMEAVVALVRQRNEKIIKAMREFLDSNENKSEPGFIN